MAAGYNQRLCFRPGADESGPQCTVQELHDYIRDCNRRGGEGGEREYFIDSSEIAILSSLDNDVG